MPDNRDLLDRFVRARNATRSAEKAAQGFVFGQRVDSLRWSRREEANALTALADWVEAKAREVLAEPQGLLPHQYIDASDDPAAWDADQCDRQAVTVAFADEKLCDKPVFLYLPAEAIMGMDPWRIITGIDRDTKTGEYIAEFGMMGERRMSADARVFAQRSTLRELGLPEGTPGGAKSPTMA